MKKLRFAILSGLVQSGHGKTISQILNDAGFEYTSSQLKAASKHLEMLGLVRLAQRQEDFTAEVTPFGKEVLASVTA